MRRPSSSGGAGGPSGRTGSARTPGLEEELVADPGEECRDPLARPEVGEHEGPLAPHPSRVALNHGEVSADVEREVDLADHEHVGARDPRPALARDLVA